MNKNFMTKLVAAALLGLFLCLGISFAQTGGTGSIVGTVSDPNGAAVKGATVVLRLGNDQLLC